MIVGQEKVSRHQGAPPEGQRLSWAQGHGSSPWMGQQRPQRPWSIRAPVRAGSQGHSRGTRWRRVTDRRRLGQAGIRARVMARGGARQHGRGRRPRWPPLMASGAPSRRMRLSHKVDPRARACRCGLPPSGTPARCAPPTHRGACHAALRRWRPASRLTSTRRASRAGHDGLRLVHLTGRRMLASRHNEDNQGVADLLLRVLLTLPAAASGTLDQRAHLRRNIRLCVTPCPTISCMAMKKRAKIAYLI